MSERIDSFRALRQDHPVFFWGTAALLLILVTVTVGVASRVPRYQQEAAQLDERMDEEERETRDRILNSRTRRSQLALALLRREMRLKALEEDEVHLAVVLEDSVLALRHGAATLREIPVTIGPDSVISGADGRTWRFVRGLGERHVDEKEVSPTYTIPEWVYVSRGDPVPAETDRTIEGGLGRYVLRLDDGSRIYTRPETGPLAAGVIPASFVVEDEAGFRAIYDAIRIDTPVYIY